MTRAALSFVLTMLVCVPAWAQRAQPLRGEADAKHFCAHSGPQAASDEDAEGYHVRRRTAAQRPLEVTIASAHAPVIGYDRVTGALEISLYRPATFAPGFSLSVNVGSAAFELPEEVAQRLWARYESGTAALKVTFLPVAWSDYEREFCRRDGDQLLVDGEVLAVDLVDEVGKSLARTQTRLGRDVALMRQHRVKGYLDGGIPVVAVSTLTNFPASGDAAPLPNDARLRAEIRAALYGCYLRGLATNARMQGALVVKLDHTGPSAAMLVDSLHDEATSACALERLRDLIRTTPLPGTLKATVIFRLEEAPSL